MYHEQNEIRDEQHKWFTMIPNIILEMGLSAHALALYLALKRSAGDGGGACFRSTDTLAQDAGMSPATVSRTKKELADSGLIIISERKRPQGGRPLHVIEVVPIWAANERYFLAKKQSPDGPSFTEEVASFPVKLTSFPVKERKNHVERTMEEEHNNLAGAGAPATAPLANSSWDDLVATPHPGATANPLDPDTPQARELFARLAANAAAQCPPRRPGRARFGSLEEKARFDADLPALADDFSYYLEDTLARGITGRAKVLAYLHGIAGRIRAQGEERARPGGNGVQTATISDGRMAELRERYAPVGRLCRQRAPGPIVRLCRLPAGHDGPHRDGEHTWSTQTTPAPAPVPAPARAAASGPGA